MADRGQMDDTFQANIQMYVFLDYLRCSTMDDLYLAYLARISSRPRSRRA